MIASLIITFTLFLPLVTVDLPKQGVVALEHRPGDMEMLDVSWYYDYSVVDRHIEGVQYVPMIWCDRWPRFAYGSQAFDYFHEGVKRLGSDYAGPLLFINEPDIPGSNADGGQCDMRPKEAAYMYGALLHEFPLAELIGPAPSHQDYYKQWAWMREFYFWIHFFGYPVPDVGALHTYMSEDPSLLLDSYFQLMAEAHGPDTVWITEMGNCDPAVITAMVQTYEADNRVERYALFVDRGWDRPECLNAFYDWPGSLTPVGKAYVEAN